MTFNDANAAAQARGLPPKVAAWVPGTKDFITRFVLPIAPIAIPPTNAFARVRISGLILNNSCANKLPVRPNPVCTSSNIKRILLF